jgi:hypothetical protein
MPAFHFGDDAVLLTLDSDGVADILAMISETIRMGSTRLCHGDVTHEFRIEPGSAAIQIGPGHVLWRLDAAKAAEVAADLNVLKQSAGHFYVDITSPADTLVISRDEYVDIAYRWVPPREDSR